MQGYLNKDDKLQWMFRNVAHTVYSSIQIKGKHEAPSKFWPIEGIDQNRSISDKVVIPKDLIEQVKKAHNL